ncbi:hypothetical protein MHBO_004059 [Bonamia ostreae]|uniref:Protein MEMO1 n=1 Tax=Bonamia ostreae TaxID=126728 RepID=A0ABV2ASA2_9EUKA
MQLRKSLFAGSWYENDKTKLSRLLKKHFDRAEAEQSKFCGNVKAIISPHAGYDYSGEIAACAYQAINPQKIKTVFVLGPSHQIYTNKCLLTTFDRFYTPFGDIEIDKNIVKDLLQQPGFSKHEPYDDEKEHSIDLCCPMLKYRMAEFFFTQIAKID